MDEAKYNIETVEHTGSTNSDVIARADKGAPEGFWLRAISQGAGRGRNARHWLSPEGNIYTSTIIRLRQDDPKVSTLAFVAAVALYDAIGHYIEHDNFMIKWPNDLLIGDSKICGILLERSGDAVVMGAGVNLLHSPQNIDRQTTNMAAWADAIPSADEFMQILVRNFAKWLDIWRLDGFAAVREYWLSKAHPIGQKLCYKEGDKEYIGCFAGLSDDGACILRLKDDMFYTVHAGDIFILG